MSTRGSRRKQGAKDSIAERYIGLPWLMVSSAAWRALSSDAVWLFIELKHQYKHAQGGDAHLILPYGDIEFHFTGRRFRQARAELERMGFIRIVERGGLYRKPTVYALSNAWELRNKELLADAKAGRIVRRRRAPGIEWPDGDPRNLGEEWRPAKAPNPGRLANLAKANAAKKAPPLIVKPRPGKPRTKAPEAAISAPSPAPPPSDLPYLTNAERREINTRLYKGERPEDLAAEIRARGRKVPLGLLPPRTN